jgi:hypothetical protein
MTIRVKINTIKIRESVIMKGFNGFIIYFTDFTERKMIFIARTTYLNFKERKSYVALLVQKSKPYISGMNPEVLRLKMIKNSPMNASIISPL